MRPAAFQLAPEYIVLYKTDYKRNVGLVTCELCVRRHGCDLRDVCAVRCEPRLPGSTRCSDGPGIHLGHMCVAR